MRSRASEGNTSESGDNFDALRLLFSTCVGVYHFVALTAAPALAAFLEPLRIGAEISVCGFFVLSGYLVLGSFQRSRDVLAYAEKRARRLYPAYAIVIGLCAIFALLVSQAARADMGAVLRYLGANLIFLNFLAPNLPGMFQDNPLQAVNGALWTLKIEVAFYCILPLIAFCARKLGPAKWLLFAMLYAAAEIWRIQFREAGGGLAILAHQLPGQLNYFVTGMALWELRGLYTPRLFAGALGFAIVAASYLYPAMESARAAALGALVIACASAPRVGSAGPFRGDISYGVYIVHFPIIQAVHSAAGGNLNLGIQAAFSAAAILASAVLLWNYVERPCLHAGSHYKSQRTRSPLTS